MSDNPSRRSLLASAATTVVANPIAFFYLFRWLTWLLALALVYGSAAPDANLRYQPGLLMYAALQLSLGLLYTAVLHPKLTRGAQESDLDLPQRDLVAAGIADMLGSLPVLIEGSAVLLLLASAFWQSVVDDPSWAYALLLAVESVLMVLWGVANQSRLPFISGVAAFVGDVL
ncbi:MAG: hypothetical protein EXR53_06450 [Dehalococcoidia bacterium]|nr:hypothetical protein [Dehalococcoidia bacterium]